MPSFFDSLAERLARRPPRRIEVPGVSLRDAAVLVPFIERQGAPHLVFIQRPAHLRTHAGQFAFPGGAREAQDASLEATALRETQEELGRELTGARLLGPLDSIPTVSAYQVHPYVALLPPDAVYAPQPEEVALVLEVPLTALMEPAIHRTEKRVVFGWEHDIHFYAHGAHVIWGATAHILWNLLGICGDLLAT